MVLVVGGGSRSAASWWRGRPCLAPAADDQIGIDRMVDRLPDALVGERLEARVHAHVAREHLGDFEEPLREVWIGLVGDVLRRPEHRGVDLLVAERDIARRSLAHDGDHDACRHRACRACRTSPSAPRRSASPGTCSTNLNGPSPIGFVANEVLLDGLVGRVDRGDRGHRSSSRDRPSRSASSRA